MKPLNVYACYNLNRDLRLSSSSGAVFSTLAENVLLQNGVVYGVIMSEDCYSAEYSRVCDSVELVKLRGSKYLQAKIGNTFKLVKADLLEEKMVLFSGTGCQINGLKKFLGKEYANLICVDVICHGAPSPALWKKYALHQEDVNGGKLQYINFRCKDDSWTDFGMKEVLSELPENTTKKIYISKDVDSYMRMFLRDYCLRPSCYECIAKNEKMSDITIADFWGIQKVAPEMNDGNGTSLVIIRTNKGQQIFDRIEGYMKIKKVSYEDGIRSNSSEYRSCPRPTQRESFFVDMQNLDFEELEKKYAAAIKRPLKVRVKSMIKKLIRKTINVFGGGEGNSFEYGLCFVFRV